MDIHSFEVHTAHLIIRPARLDEVEQVLRYYVENRTHMSRVRPTFDDNFFTPESILRLLEQDELERHTDRSLRIYIFLRDNHTVAGHINFANISRGAAQYCTLGYAIAASWEGRGLMREALSGVIPVAFDVLHLHRISAGYLPENIRSGMLLQRLGFRYEGYARDYLFLNGAWRDHRLVALLNPAWRPH